MSYFLRSLTIFLLLRKLKWSESDTQSCPTLWDPMDCSLPGSSVRGILQARILELVAIPFSRRSSQSRDQTQFSSTAGRFFIIWATRKAQKYWSGQPIPSPRDLPDLGIEPRSPALQVDSLPAELPHLHAGRRINYDQNIWQVKRSSSNKYNIKMLSD